MHVHAFIFTYDYHTGVSNFFRIVVYDWQVNVAKDGTEMTEFRESSDTKTSTLSESKF